MTFIQKRARYTAMVGLAVAVIFWAGNSIVGRMSAGVIPPVSLAFWRWVLAFLLLLPFAWQSIMAQKATIYACKWRLLTLGILAITSFNTLVYIAAQATQAINIALIQTSLPLMTFLLSFFILKETPSKRQLAGLLFIFCGLLVILTHGNLQQLSQLTNNRGDLYMLVAVLVWGLYTVLLRRFLLPITGLALLTVLIGMGAAVLLPFYLLELSMKGGFTLSLHSGGMLFYVTVFASIASYLCWNNGVKVLGSNLASMFNTLMPVFTAILGLIILQEPLYGYHYAGAALIFSGLWLALFKLNTSKPSQQ